LDPNTTFDYLVRTYPNVLFQMVRHVNQPTVVYYNSFVQDLGPIYQEMIDKKESARHVNVIKIPTECPDGFFLVNRHLDRPRFKELIQLTVYRYEKNPEKFIIDNATDEKKMLVVRTSTKPKVGPIYFVNYQATHNSAITGDFETIRTISYQLRDLTELDAAVDEFFLLLLKARDMNDDEYNLAIKEKGAIDKLECTLFDMFLEECRKVMESFPEFLLCPTHHKGMKIKRLQPSNKKRRWVAAFPKVDKE